MLNSKTKNLAAKAGRLIWAGLVDLVGAAVVAMAAMAVGAMAISVSAYYFGFWWL